MPDDELYLGTTGTALLHYNWTGGRALTDAPVYCIDDGSGSCWVKTKKEASRCQSRAFFEALPHSARFPADEKLSKHMVKYDIARHPPDTRPGGGGGGRHSVQQHHYH